RPGRHVPSEDARLYCWFLPTTANPVASAAPHPAPITAGAHRYAVTDADAERDPRSDADADSLRRTNRRLLGEHLPAKRQGSANGHPHEHVLGSGFVPDHRLFLGPR